MDVENDSGDTPLLLAAQEQQIDVIEILAKYGASFSERNMQGMSVWDFAIEADDNDLLNAIVKCYRKLQKGEENKFSMPPGKTPLHSAALKGDCEKIRVLKSLGADMNSVDEDGNTILHLAARENQTQVCHLAYI